MYKVRHVAQQCGVSASAVYKILRQVDNGTVNVEDRLSTQENGVTLITEDGLRYFLDRFGTADPPPPDPGSAPTPEDHNLVASLLRQLEEKDRQLAEKDKQIGLLIEQSRNYQVLLKQEQDLTLQLAAPQKPGFWKRLFGRPEPAPQTHDPQDQTPSPE